MYVGRWKVGVSRRIKRFLCLNWKKMQTLYSNIDNINLLQILLVLIEVKRDFKDNIFMLLV